jgi:hypothetical protein
MFSTSVVVGPKPTFSVVYSEISRFPQQKNHPGTFLFQNSLRSRQTSSLSFQVQPDADLHQNNPQTVRRKIQEFTTSSRDEFLMNLVREGIGYSDNTGEKESAPFEKLFLGGKKCQKQKQGKDHVFGEVQDFVFEH